MRVFMAVSNDNIGGRGRLRRPDLVLQKAQTSAVIGGVVDTGKQFRLLGYFPVTRVKFCSFLIFGVGKLI